MEFPDRLGLPRATAGQAVLRKEIPAKYKDLQFLGGGNTSVILAKDEETALVFTRDRMKAEWLLTEWGLGLGKHIEEFEGHLHPDEAARALNIIVVEMPRLYPLETKNRIAVRKEVFEFQRVMDKIRSRSSTDKLNELTEWYEENKPDSRFARLFEFLSNYSDEDINFDIATRQFLQTKSGEIVMVDPVA